MNKDEEKKPEEEKTADAQPEAPSDTPQEKPQNDPETEEDKPEGKETPANAETPAEDAQTSESDGAEGTDKPPELSEEDKLREENFRLKTQLEAMKIGFTPDVLEDAVVLAENIVKRDGGEITAALEAVAKKYPDWKGGKSDGKAKSSIKIGADSSGKNTSDDNKIDRAFGLKKKG